MPTSSEKADRTQDPIAGSAGGSSSRSWASTRRSRRCPTMNCPLLQPARCWWTSRQGQSSPTTRRGCPTTSGWSAAGQVTLQASADGTTIDTVTDGGIFGYTPLLTGGGMEFVARATDAEHPDPAAGCAGAGAVRQTRGPGVSGIDGVERGSRRSPDDCADDRQQTGRRTGRTAMCCSSGPTRRCATRCAG